MQEEMVKSLIDLIDESLAELDELKKSDRFSASEIKLGDSGSGIADEDKNGKLDKEETEKMEDADMMSEEAMKAEGKNRESDPNGGNHQIVKGEDEEDEEEDEDKKKKDDEDEDEDDDMDKAEGKNRESDPNGGNHQIVKMEKSIQENNDLMKSYVDERISPIEDKISTLLGLVQEIADSPVPSKSVSYKDVQPLKKSVDAPEALTKAQAIDKLFEMKKSGENVDTTDITAAELGTPADLAKVVEKYSLKGSN
jgi:hypothetical protein